MLNSIKSTIEKSGEFGAKDLFTLMLSTPQTDFESGDVQRIVIFIREECGVHGRAPGLPHGEQFRCPYSAEDYSNENVNQYHPQARAQKECHFALMYVAL